MNNVDLTVLNQLAADIGPADLRSVLTTFESDVLRLGAALVAAADVGDMSAYRRSAHAMAGAAGAVGAVTLEQAARRAMQAALSDVSAAAADAAMIRRLGNSTVYALRRFVAEGVPGA
jgi:HPt (histidine-containing phosphotransfer) domain-containing protein